ncbi:hypothetical protein glysoja_047284, partial [Glycine soja]
GFSTNKPPMFRGIKYNYWTERMITHFESIHIDLWDVTKNGDYIPYDGQVNEIPRGQWTEEQKLRFLINSYAQNVMLCALLKEEYTKVRSFKSVKQMWDTLAITYDRTSQVKRNKLSLLTRKYETFSIEEGKDIQCMFGCFQTFLNELRSLALKNIDSMSLEELVGTLKVHEQELQQDKGTKREKSLALSSQKNKKALSSREQVSRSLSKDLKADDSSDEFEEDEFTFISRKAAK